MTGDVWDGVCVWICVYVCVCLSLYGCTLSIRILMLLTEWGHFGWSSKIQRLRLVLGLGVGVVDMVHVKSWIKYYVIMTVSTKIEI